MDDTYSIYIVYSIDDIYKTTDSMDDTYSSIDSMIIPIQL